MVCAVSQCLAGELSIRGQLHEVLAIKIGETKAMCCVDDQVEHRPAKLRQLVSPGNRPITLVRRRTFFKDRSKRFVERNRLRMRGRSS